MTDYYHPIYPDALMIERKPRPEKRKRLRKLLLYYFGDKCLCCKARSIKLTLDHVLPRCLGGKAEPSNLQLLCYPCNHKKADQIIDYRPYALDFL